MQTHSDCICRRYEQIHVLVLPDSRGGGSVSPEIAEQLVIKTDFRVNGRFYLLLFTFGKHFVLVDVGEMLRVVYVINSHRGTDILHEKFIFYGLEFFGASERVNLRKIQIVLCLNPEVVNHQI